MIAKALLSRVLEKQRKTLEDKPPGQTRHLAGQIPYLSDRALLLGGVRGSGRSTLLLQLLRNEYPQAWYADFEDPRLAGFEAPDFSRMEALLTESGRGVALLDKVDRAPGWMGFANGLLDNGIKVVATVSQESLLDMEAAQRRRATGAESAAGRLGLPGPRKKNPSNTPPSARESEQALFERHCERYIPCRVSLFSYPEFLEIHHKRGSEAAVQEFLTRGAFPEQQKNPRPEALYDLYEKILARDVLLKRGVRDQATLRRLALRLLGSPGEAVTANALRKELKIKAVSTVSEHMEHLERAGLVGFVPFWSESPARRHINPRRVYPVDTALAAALSLEKTPDKALYFKTMIHQHLLDRHEALFYTAEEGGCDFVALSEGRPALCVQACYEGEDPDALQQCAEGLLRALELTGAPRGLIVTPGTNDRLVCGEREVEVIEADLLLEAGSSYTG